MGGEQSTESGKEVGWLLTHYTWKPPDSAVVNEFVKYTLARHLFFPACCICYCYRDAALI